MERFDHPGISVYYRDGAYNTKTLMNSSLYRNWLNTHTRPEVSNIIMRISNDNGDMYGKCFGNPSFDFDDYKVWTFKHNDDIFFILAGETGSSIEYVKEDNLISFVEELLKIIPDIPDDWKSFHEKLHETE